MHHQPPHNRDPYIGKLLGDFEIGHFLARGGFGQVHYCNNRVTHEQAIVKIIPKTTPNFQGPYASYFQGLLYTEINLMRKFKHHPNIISLLSHFESPSTHYLVIPYCNKGDMEQYMQRNGIRHFDEKTAVFYLRQIASGFQELCMNNVIHRDFKLGNLFMHNDTIIIGDFGAAKQLGAASGRTGTFVGGSAYVAPEMLANEIGDNVQYNSKIDIWSIGVTFYVMLFGITPFDPRNMRQDIKIRSGRNLKIPRDINNISKASEDLLKRMMVEDPVSRIDWPQFFNHELFNMDFDFPPPERPSHMPSQMSSKQNTTPNSLSVSNIHGNSTGQGGRSPRDQTDDYLSRKSHQPSPRKLEDSPSRDRTKVDPQTLKVIDNLNIDKNAVMANWNKAKMQSGFQMEKPLVGPENARLDTVGQQIDENAYVSNIEKVRSMSDAFDQFKSYQDRYQFELIEMQYMYDTVSAIRWVNKTLEPAEKMGQQSAA
jgi:serine/threonine protein kinase